MIFWTFSGKSMRRSQKPKAARKKEKTQQEPASEEPAQAPISVNLMREYTFSTLDAVIDAAHGLNNFFRRRKRIV